MSLVFIVWLPFLILLLYIFPYMGAHLIVCSDRLFAVQFCFVSCSPPTSLDSNPPRKIPRLRAKRRDAHENPFFYFSFVIAYCSLYIISDHILSYLWQGMFVNMVITCLKEELGPKDEKWRQIIYNLLFLSYEVNPQCNFWRLYFIYSSLIHFFRLLSFIVSALQLYGLCG